MELPTSQRDFCFPRLLILFSFDLQDNDYSNNLFNTGSAKMAMFINNSNVMTLLSSTVYISHVLIDVVLNCCISYRKKSDIWALGCILYELVTLRKAFEAEVNLAHYLHTHMHFTHAHRHTQRRTHTQTHTRMHVHAHVHS